MGLGLTFIVMSAEVVVECKSCRRLQGLCVIVEVVEDCVDDLCFDCRSLFQTVVDSKLC